VKRFFCPHDHIMEFHGRSVACYYRCPKCGDTTAEMSVALYRIRRGRVVRVLLWCAVIGILILGIRAGAR
jgi:hypothetical protein